MAWAVPALLEAVPMNDAADVSADSATLSDRAVILAIDSVLGHASPEDRALATLDLVHAVDFTRLDIFREIGDDGSLAFYIFTQGQAALGFPRRIEQVSEPRFVVLIKRDEVERAGNAIRHSGAAVAGVDINTVRSVAARVGQAVDWLHNLARPAIVRRREARKAVAGPGFQLLEPFLHVIGGAGPMIFAAADQPILTLTGRLEAHIIVGPERIPHQRVLDTAARNFACDCIRPHRYLLGVDGDAVVHGEFVANSAAPALILGPLSVVMMTRPPSSSWLT